MTSNEKVRAAIREGWHNNATGGEDFLTHPDSLLHPKGPWNRPEDHPNWNLFLGQK